MDAELQDFFALQMNVTDDCIIEERHSTISNREIVKQWEATVYKKLRNKLFNHATGDTFQEVLKEYLRILKERATNFKDKLLLKEAIVKHLNFFYLYYDEFSATRCANLNYVESILLIVCSLELEFVRHMKKSNFANKEYMKITNCVAQKIINYLTLYLLNEERRIFHVLLRLEYKCDSPAWKDVMHIVYRHNLTILPVRDYSDEGFCRHYLLCQKFKNITEKSKHDGMDKIMYFRFNKTSNYIKENKILRSILLPSDDSIADLVDVLADGQQAAVNMYFRYIERNNEDGKSQAINIDSDDEELGEKSLNSFHSTEKQFDSLIKSEGIVKTNFEDVSCSKTSTDDEVVCIIEDDSDIEVVGDEEEHIKTPLQSFPVTEPKSFLESISCSEVIPIVTNVNLSSVSQHASNIKSTEAMEVEETTSLSTQDDSHMNNLVAKYLEYMQVDDTITKSTASETTPVDEGQLAAVDTSKESESMCNTNTATEDNEKETNVINNKSATLTHCVSNNNNVQHKTDIELSNNVSNLHKVLSVHNCTCLCAHVCSKNAENVDNRTESCGLKTNSRTVEIQTESYNGDVMCGLDTPPPSEDISTTCTDSMPHSDVSVISKNTPANLIEPQENLMLKLKSSSDKTLIPVPALNQTRVHLLESIKVNISNETKINEEPTGATNLGDTPLIHQNDINEEQQELSELSRSSNHEMHKDMKELQSDPVITPVDLIFNDYSNTNISNNEKDFENAGDPPIRDCHNTDEESLDNISLTIDEDNSQLSLENDNSVIQNVSFVEKSPQIVNKFESFSKNSVESNFDKNKTSVNNTNVNKTNLNKTVKLNGNTSIFSEEIKNKTKPSNILFTSNERVSASLSVFAKFEEDCLQEQSDFSINSLLNEPLHSLDDRSMEHSDNTNSSDSLSLSGYSRTYSPTKASSLNNSPVNSPISSPPFEYIQPQDFMNHIDDHLTSCEDVYSKSIPTSMNNVIDTNKHKTNSNLLGKSSIISKPGTKRKRTDSGNPNRKPKVNFGNIETRLISPRPSRLITQEVLNLATDSMQEYRIDDNDKKLVYSKPQVVLQLDTPKQLESKIKDLQLCSVLINILEKKGMEKIPDKTCILDRFDYKKPVKEGLQTDLLANKQTEGLPNSTFTTLSSNFGDVTSISGHSTSSNHVHASTPIISGLGSLHKNSTMTKKHIDENITTKKNKPNLLPYTRKVPDVRISESKRSRGRPKKDADKKSNNSISSSSTFSYGSS